MDPADRDALQRHYTDLPLLWLAKFVRNTVYWRDRQMSLIVLLVWPTPWPLLYHIYLLMCMSV